jgi:hypothetical protein
VRACVCLCVCVGTVLVVCVCVCRIVYPASLPSICPRYGRFKQSTSTYIYIYTQYGRFKQEYLDFIRAADLYQRALFLEVGERGVYR